MRETGQSGHWEVVGVGVGIMLKKQSQSPSSIHAPAHSLLVILRLRGQLAFLGHQRLEQRELLDLAGAVELDRLSLECRVGLRS